MAATYEFDLAIAGRTAKVIRKFPANFGFIDYRNVMTVSVSDGPEDSPIAEVKLVPAWLWPVSPFRVAILFYAEKFESLAKHVQDMVIVHELEHIIPHPLMEGEYKTKKHEVNDWQEMVMTLGPNWIEELSRHPEFSVMLTDETDWSKALRKMSIFLGHMENQRKVRKRDKGRKRRVHLRSARTDN